MDKPKNHQKKFTEKEREELKEFAKKCNSKEDMISKVREFKIAEKFERTEGAIFKQIEDIKQAEGYKNFFWAK